MKNIEHGSVQKKKVLISGASIAGLSAAYWMNRSGYQVTVVEKAGGLRKGGAAVNLNGAALDIARRMGIYGQLKLHGLNLEMWEYKNAADITVGSLLLRSEGVPLPEEEVEIERDKLVRVLFNAVENRVEIIFGNSITGLNETDGAVNVAFSDGAPQAFDLVLGCDGLHSGVRKMGFGNLAEHTLFMEHYFSLTIVNKLLIRPNTAQMFNTPGKVIILNAYNHKTDICFCFFSDKEISYDYRDAGQQRKIIAGKFDGEGWRTAELLEEIDRAGISYFDKFCQVTMQSFTKGRVALVGDAGYCASPAAGIGASLAMMGAAAVADALEANRGNYAAAFRDYNQTMRPLVEEAQSTARIVLAEYLIPGSEEGIQQRNARTVPF